MAQRVNQVGNRCSDSEFRFHIILISLIFLKQILMFALCYNKLYSFLYIFSIFKNYFKGTMTWTSIKVDGFGAILKNRCIIFFSIKSRFLMYICWKKREIRKYIYILYFTQVSKGYIKILYLTYKTAHNYSRTTLLMRENCW